MRSISYDDDNACTDDIFDVVNGVSHTLVDCDDDNAYTVDCCDDNAYTVDCCDVESGCESYDLNCDDSIAWTDDNCDTAQFPNLEIIVDTVAAAFTTLLIS